MKRFAIASICACMAMSGCIYIAHGLDPISPSYNFSNRNARVNTLKPRLEWEAYSDVSGKENIKYQLEILSEKGRRIFKDGLQETSYTVEDPLEPDTDHQWRVRAVWTVDGKPDAGKWNYRTQMLFTPIGGAWGGRAYSFTTPKQ
jgi:hypothetical protein